MWILFLILSSQLHEQTDWMGGYGIKGPVTDWGTRYFTGDSITAATEGQVSLVAHSWDYTSTGWLRHDIDLTSGIIDHTQGFMPGNINGDNFLDLVAYVIDTVYWYQNNGSWSFTKNMVGRALVAKKSGVTHCPSIWVADMNKDNNDDILVATDTIGLGWFQNVGNGTSWIYHNIEAYSSGGNKGYHRPSAVDVDLDGDMDVIAVDNNRTPQRGNIYLFRRDGTTGGSNDTTFTKETIRTFGFMEPDQAWRVYPVDFNNDKYPDLYAVGGHAFVFINKGAGANAGKFDQKYWRPDMDATTSMYVDWDGAWAVDINMDGWKDLITDNQQDNNPPTHPLGFYVHENDGTGMGYNVSVLKGCNTNAYTDGAMAVDLDLDGLPDLLGVFTKVGWFKQAPADSFTEYLIDDVMQNKYAHWIYAAKLSSGCTPKLDLMVTDKGAHIVYENKMLQGFAINGKLESSVLQLGTAPSPQRKMLWFGWEVCVPESGTIKLYWRSEVDSISDSITNKPWNGPYYAVKEKDSISLPGNPCPRFFQYKVELSPNLANSDIGILERIWMVDTICESGVQESAPVGKGNLIKIIDGDRILLSVSAQISNAELSIYNTTGEKVTVLHKGTISAKEYVFKPRLKAKGVYLVVLATEGENHQLRTLEKAKFIKYK